MHNSLSVDCEGVDELEIECRTFQVFIQAADKEAADRRRAESIKEKDGFMSEKGLSQACEGVNDVANLAKLKKLISAGDEYADCVF
jgi:hypothetical protein